MALPPDQTLLIVDDDTDLTAFLGEELQRREGMRSVQAHTGSRGIVLARREHFAAILLNVWLPDIDGREVCRVLRRHGVSAPIVMLTAADSESDIILGLDAGANDYVTKPFRLAVLLARLRAQLRQHQRSEGAVFTFGPYIFRPATKTLMCQGSRERIRLTGTEATILRRLCEATPAAIDTGSLFASVWRNNAQVSRHTLEAHIYRLRQKIEPDPAHPRVLITVEGGYRLVP